MTKPVAENHELSRAEAIDRICTAFEAAWKKGEAPRLEDWLRDLSGADRVALLKELVLLDAHYRRRRGDTVAVADYQQRFAELEKDWLEEAVASLPKTTADESKPDSGLGAVSPEVLLETIHYSGDYELREELGRGGMGVVYRGNDRDLSRTLAVKVLLDKHADNKELISRFLEEAQIMGQLQHPGVAPIHDVGRLADGRPFFSMKQIKGQTLAELLRSQEPGVRSQGSDSEASSPDLPRWLSIFAQVSQTVAFAHSRGILHRDLKPGNVMVGAFGEVQVMDWGLAKVLGAAGGRAPPADPVAQHASTIFTVRTVAPEGTETAAGRVLGTPAYMAPEQARGEIEYLDERCDVFGLGAILCEILTGRPPFPGDTQLDSHRKAMKCDLRDTFTRLECCGVDSELVGLAQRCLAAEKEDRPRQAGEVAEAVARYQAEVLERLRRAEVERAQAQTRATEECRRRRVWLALAGMVFVFVLAGAGASVWYYQDRAERAVEDGRKAQKKEDLERHLEKEFTEADRERESLHRQLADPLNAAKLLSDIDGWKAQVNRGRERWKRAKFLADTGKELLEETWFARLKKLDQQMGKDEGSWQWAKKLDDIWLSAATLVDGKHKPNNGTEEYPPLFLQLGLDAVKGNEIQVAAKIRRSPIRFALVAALDNWAGELPLGSRLAPRLLAIARRADPDPWRDQVRDVQVWKALPKLLGLARDARLDQQTPQIILLLAASIHGRKDRGEAAALLRRALVHYPQDFWLHFHVGLFVQDPAEQAGCYRAALAVRPKSTPAYNNLGCALGDNKDLNGAILCMRKALALQPKSAPVHNNLGRLLKSLKDLDGAIEHYRKAIELEPRVATPYYNLAIALAAKNDLDGAIKHFHKAIERAPKLANAHVGIGNALQAKNDLDTAIGHYHKAIELEPNMAIAYYNLGIALAAKNDLDGAVKHFHKAIELDPNFAETHRRLGIALAAKNDPNAAIKHFHKAIELDPNFAETHRRLGIALAAMKDLDGAIKHFRIAIELNPNDATSHFNLGTALHNKDLDGAIQCYYKAIELDPMLAPAYRHLGIALIARNDLDGAIQHSHKAIELDPNYAPGHCNLGHVLRQQGKFAEALESLKTGHELPCQQPDWPRRSAQWVKDCERLLELDRKLPAIFKGDAQPRDAAEQAELANLCLVYKKHHVAAAHFYAAALKAEPKLADQHRYNAACAAALAAGGQGNDADKREKDEPARLRQQALDWLRAELAGRKQQLQTNPRTAGQVQSTLRHWQKDTDLAGVREEKALATLPDAQRKQWLQFWGEVEQVLRSAN